MGYDQEGKFRYACKVGGGFTDRQIREFTAGVAQIGQRECPFESIPETGRSRWACGLTAEERRTADWLKPVLVLPRPVQRMDRRRALAPPVVRGLAGGHRGDRGGERGSGVAGVTGA